jgi:electron transport complex protein RnfE
MNIKKFAEEGILTSNPLFMQLLGACPALATTTDVVNGIGMGLSTGSVLIFSNLLISLLRKFIPKRVRLASYIVVISMFVTTLEMLLKAYIPALDRSLGVFIPLIVVNCLIFARAESFASRNDPVSSFFDGVFTGLGFTLALFLLSAMREVIGAGTFAGIQIIPPDYAVKVIVSPAGAFISLGVLIAAFKSVIYIVNKNRENKEKEAEKAEGAGV